MGLDRDRREGSGLVVETVGSVTGVRRAEWDALAETRAFYLSHGWLRTVEGEPGVDQSYTLVRSGGRLVGAAPSYVWGGRQTAMMTYYDPFEVVAAERTSSAERSRWFPTLLAGARSGFVNDLLVADDLNVDERAGVVGALAQATLAPFEAGGAATASWPYLTSSAALELAPRLQARGMLVLLYLAEAILDLAGGSFDDYLASRDHRLRNLVKRDVARAAATGARFGTCRLSSCVDEAAALLHQHHRRYGLPETLDQCRAYLSAQAEALDDRAVVFEARERGALAGFALAYPWNGTLYLRVAGISDSFVRSGLYFALVFHHPAEYALDHGLTRLHLGSGSFEAKVRRGARLAPLWAAVAPPRDETARWRALLTDWTERAPMWWRRSLDEVAGSPAAALAEPGPPP